MFSNGLMANIQATRQLDIILQSRLFLNETVT